MKTYLLLFLLYLFACVNVNAQNVSTIKITTTEGVPVTSAYIKATTCGDTNKVVLYQLSKGGIVKFNINPQFDCLLLEVFGYGFESKKNKFSKSSFGKADTLYIQLDRKKVVELQDVQVRSKILPIVIKNDTTNYKIEKFVNGTERKLQDILEKLPGIDVNKKTGEIRFKGKPIESLMLDGDDLFGKNYQVGSKNISASMIEGVQAIENFSDNYVLRNFEKEEKVALNIKLKKTGLRLNANFDIGAGLINENALLSDYNGNILGLNSNHKFFSILSYKNAGITRSIKNFFGNTRNESQRDKIQYFAEKILPENNFSAPIDNNRLNNNAELFGNYNGLFRLTNKMSVKVNGFYTTDNIRNIQNIINTYYLRNDTVINIDNIANTKKPASTDFEIYIRNNISTKTLLENKTTFFDEKTNLARDITTNFIPKFNSSLQGNNLFLKHQFKLSQRLGAKHAFQAIAIYSNNNLQQQLELEPSIFKRLISLSDIQTSVYKKQSFQAKAVLLGKMKNGVYNLSLSNNTAINNFYSTLQNDSNQTVLISSLNNVRYKKNEFKQTGSLDYRFDKWRITPSFAVTYLTQTLENRKNKETSSMKSIVFEPQVNINYALNSKQALHAIFSAKQKPNVEEHIFTNNILQTNRFVTANEPNLSLLRELYYNFGYSFRDLYNQFEASTDVSYTNSNGSYLSNYNITDTVIYELLFFKPLTNSAINANVVTKKYFPSIKSTLKFSIGYNYSTYNNLVSNTIIRNNINKLLDIEFFYKSVFKGPINFVNVFSFSKSTFINKNIMDENIQFAIESIQNKFEINIRAGKQVLCAINMDSYLPNLKSSDSYLHFLDCSISYATKNKKAEFKLLGKNLLLNTSYTTFQNSDFSKGINEINLLPRFIAFNFTYGL